MIANNSTFWFLEKINVKNLLTQEELIKFDELTTMKKAEKNDYVYFPEEPSSVIYFLKSGRVKIVTNSDDGKEVIKAILYPGEFFGEMGITGEETRTDYAVVMESDTVFCTMKTAVFENLMESNPKFSLAVTKIIGERLRKVERRLESLIFKDAHERIVDFIKEMALEYGSPVGDEILLKHNLTHQDIASITATSRQTVTTVLNILRSKDLVYMERNKILVRNIKTLGL